jgi:hypothetical protein
MVTHSYTLTFNARLADIDSGDSVDDPRLLRQLDGVEEASDLADYVVDGELPGIELSRARPVLRFDERTNALSLEVEFVTAGAVSDRDREFLARFWKRQVGGGWGTNYEFALPANLENYTVDFDEEPREKVLQVAATELAPLIARYGSLRPADIVGKSPDELHAIRDALAPHREGLLLVATPEARAVYALYQLACTLLQHSAVEKAGAKVPKVSLDNLDALDDLPDDVF